MNQVCRVCGEVAAGYHFGAFTCEGCKSFFGRTYNNRSSIGECKNNNQCVINKKNRTSCKSCRLKKCFQVGMSKSGSRYGRRSNWFKIHCLLQDQGIMQQQQQQQHLHLQDQQQHQQASMQGLQSPQAHLLTTTTQHQINQLRQQQQLSSSPPPPPLQQQQHHQQQNNIPQPLLASQQQQVQQQQQQLQQQQQQQQVNPMAAAAAAAALGASAVGGTNARDGADPQQLSSAYASAIAQFYTYCYLINQLNSQTSGVGGG